MYGPSREFFQNVGFVKCPLDCLKQFILTKFEGFGRANKGKCNDRNCWIPLQNPKNQGTRLIPNKQGKNWNFYKSCFHD